MAVSAKGKPGLGWDPKTTILLGCAAALLIQRGYSSCSMKGWRADALIKWAIWMRALTRCHHAAAFSPSHISRGCHTVTGGDGSLIKKREKKPRGPMCVLSCYFRFCIQRFGLYSAGRTGRNSDSPVIHQRVAHSSHALRRSMDVSADQSAPAPPAPQRSFAAQNNAAMSCARSSHP